VKSKKDNSSTLNDLDWLNTEDLANLSIEELAFLDAKLNEFNKINSERRVKLQTAIDHKFGVTMQDMLVDSGRDTGQVSLFDNEYKITRSVGKEVTWDQNKLIEALDQIPTQIAKDLVKATFRINERKYLSCSNEIKEKLLAARTVMPRKPTYKIENKKETL
tara:strand:+ start:630 stop:1115 length:486 start_codon:yes stop_codon:yes gene_type:complete